MEEILASITTKSEALIFEKEIQVLINSFYQPPGFEMALKTQVRESTALLIEGLIAGKDYEKVLKSLKTAISKLKEVKLTMSFEPSTTTVDKIYSWIRINLGPDHILDINTKPEILAGITISYKGRYRDYSVAKIFDSTFQNSIPQIAKLLNLKD